MKLFWRHSITCIIILIGAHHSFGQSVWSLEKCIQYGLQQSLDVKQAQLSIEGAKNTLSATQQSRYPNFEVSSNFGYNFGRTIDPTTNTFETKTIGFNSISAGGGLVLFNSNKINNSIKQSKYDKQASEIDLQTVQNNLSLTIAQAYLQILFADENLSNAKRQLAQINDQLAVTEKLVIAGSRPENDKLDIYAQIATVEQNIVSAQNTLDISYLNLKQILLIDPSTEFVVEKPNFVFPEIDDTNTYSLNEIFSQSVNIQPQIKANEIRLKSALLGEKIAKANYYPRLTAFANLSSSYSSLAKDYQNPDLSNTSLVLQDPVAVKLNGEDALLSTYSLTGLVFPNIKYFDQISQNFGQAVGVGITIPIYSNGTVRANAERARLNAANVELQGTQLRQRLKTDIQQAVANAKAAKKGMQASEKTFLARKATYENAQKKYNIGAINTFELTTAKTNLDTSETNFLISKYDYLFKLKIVDFYLGKKMTL